MGEVVPGPVGVAGGVLRVRVEVRRHHGHRVAGVEGARDLLGRTQVVGLEELHLPAELGVVVAAPERGLLRADDPARCVGIDGVRRIHQIAEEAGPDGVVVGHPVEQRREIEERQRLVELRTGVLRGDVAGRGRGAAVGEGEPRLVRRIVRAHPPRQGMHERSPRDLVVQGVSDAQGALRHRLHPGAHQGDQLSAQRLVERLGAVAAGAHGAGVGLGRTKARAIRRAAQVQEPLGGGVVVVEAQPPLFQPGKGALAVVGEPAIDAVVAADAAGGVVLPQGPLVPPRHHEPGAPPLAGRGGDGGDAPPLRRVREVGQVSLLVPRSRILDQEHEEEQGRGM